MDAEPTLISQILSGISPILSAVKFLLSFVFVFGLVVFIHELGHFLTAKFFGVLVEEFALGMGPKIFSRKKGGTEYKLCIFPIGGYVKMSGEEPEEAEGKKLSERDYYGQPPFKRFLITFSGPFMNFVLALLIFILVPMIGLKDYDPIIGPIEKGSTGEVAGLLPGDVVVSADSKKIRTFSELLEAIDNAEDSISLEVLRNDVKKFIAVPIEKKKDEDFFRNTIEVNTIGIGAFLEPLYDDSDLKEKEKRKMSLSPSGFINLQSEDRITSINGKNVVFWQDISRILNDEYLVTTDPTLKKWEEIWNTPYVTETDKQERTKIIKLSFKRNGEEITKPVVLHVIKSSQFVKPKDKSEPDVEYYWIIGIPFSDTRKIFHYTPFSALVKGVEHLNRTTVFIVKVFGLLFQGRLTTKALGGPIMIGKMVKTTSDSGIIALLIFTAVLSLHLGMINYVPFPALDGGHMAFSILEMIRRKPLSLKTMEYIQKTGFAILIGLIIIVSYNDVIRLITGE